MALPSTRPSPATMAPARSSDDSANEGDVRGAADAAPRSTTPLTLVEASIAGLEALVAEAQRLAEDISEAELSGAESAADHSSGEATKLLAELLGPELEL